MGFFRKRILKLLCSTSCSKSEFLSHVHLSSGRLIFKTSSSRGNRSANSKMTIQFDDIIEACNIVAQQEQINVCVTESLKGAGIAGIGAFTLGVIFGPMGIAVGGAIGGYAGSQMCKRYTPLWKIIAEMKKEDKVKLVNHMMKIVQQLDISDAILLISLVTNQQAVGRKLFVDGLVSFASQLSR